MPRVLVHPVLSPVKIDGRKLLPGDVIAAHYTLPGEDVAELIRRGVLGWAEEREFPDAGPEHGAPVEIGTGPTGHPAVAEGGGDVAAVATPTPEPTPDPVTTAPAASEPAPAPATPVEKPAGKPRAGKAVS